MECKICGSKDNLEKHHINYEKNKTVYLCKECHTKVHKNPNHKYYPQRETTPEDIDEKIILELVEKAPRTIGEIHREIGKKNNWCRQQTKTLMMNLATSGEFKAHQPKQKASKIFYRHDYDE